MAERVLVVDDEEAIATTLREVLERAGYLADTAGTAEDARAKVREGDYDVILLDLRLGADDGLQLLDQLRRTAPDTAIVVLTGYGTLDSAAQAARLGAIDYLLKPCDVDELKAAVARGATQRAAMLAQRHQTEEERRWLLEAERAARFAAESAARRTSLLQQVTAALSAAVTVAEVGQAIAVQAVSATGANAGALGVISDDSGWIRLAGTAGYGDAAITPFARFPVDAALPMSEVTRTGEALWLADRAAFRARYPDLATEPGRVRLAVVPLKLGEQVLGAISLSFAGAGPFDPGEREFIQVVAHECARALERAFLFEDAQLARTEAELSHRRLRELFLAAPALIAVTRGPDHVVEIANGRFLEVLGRADPAAAVGKPVREAFPELLSTGYLELADRVFASGEAFVDPALPSQRDRDGDGQIDQHWTSVVIQPYHDAAGQVAGLLFHGVDVTAQKKAEWSQGFLAEASKLLAVSLDEEEILASVARLAVPVLGDWCTVDVVDLVGGIRRAAVVCADPGKEAIAREVRESYPPDPRWEEGVTRVIRAGQTLIYEEITDALLRANTRDERQYQLYRALGLRAALIVPLIARGRVLGALTVVASSDHAYDAADRALAEDLARRVALTLDNARLFQAEQRARQRAEALQAITAALAERHTIASMADIVVDQAVRTLGAQSGAVGLLVDDGASFTVLRTGGYPDDRRVQDELQNWTRFPVSETNAWGRAVRRVEAIFAESREERLGRDPQLAATQDALGLNAAATLPLVVGGRPIGVLWINFPERHLFPPEEREFLGALAHQCAQAIERARLVEAEREARRRLQEAVRLRDEFLSVAAHELKTPLTSLRAAAQLLMRILTQSGRVDPVRLRQRLSDVDRQSERLARLVDQLLDVSQIEVRRFTLERTPTDIAELAGRVVAVARRRSGRHEIDLQVGGPIFALVDPGRLDQVLQHLIDNAIRFSPDGGPIRLEVTRDGAGEVLIVVTDRGMGIPVERRDQIFDRYYQAHAASHLSGLGLGLYLCREIIALHGGSLNVEFPAEGGTRFIVRLAEHGRSD